MIAIALHQNMLSNFGKQYRKNILAIQKNRKKVQLFGKKIVHEQFQFLFAFLSVFFRSSGFSGPNKSKLAQKFCRNLQFYNPQKTGLPESAFISFTSIAFV